MSIIKPDNVPSVIRMNLLLCHTRLYLDLQWSLCEVEPDFKLGFRSLSFFVVIEKMRIISEDDNGIMLGCWNARTSRNVLDFLIFQVLSLIIGSTLPDSENIWTPTGPTQSRASLGPLYWTWNPSWTCNLFKMRKNESFKIWGTKKASLEFQAVSSLFICG